MKYSSFELYSFKFFDQIIRFEDLQNGYNLLCNNINIKEQNLLQLRKTLKKRTIKIKFNFISQGGG